MFWFTLGGRAGFGETRRVVLHVREYARRGRESAITRSVSARAAEGFLEELMELDGLICIRRFDTELYACHVHVAGVSQGQWKRFCVHVLGLHEVPVEQLHLMLMPPMGQMYSVPGGILHFM